MTSLTYRDLTHRVHALYLISTPDQCGGYRETWQGYALMWCSMRIKESAIYITIRRQENYELLKGFMWKKKFFCVTKDPILTSCQRFVIYKTLLKELP